MGDLNKMSEQIIIIPNEDFISTDIWCSKLLDNERHGKKIYDYSLLHNLGLNFETVGVESGNFNGHLWGIALAKLGHVSIHCGEKKIIYIPDIISKNQYMFFKKHRDFINRFRNDISACILHFENNEFEMGKISGDYNNNIVLFPINLFYEELKIKYDKFNNLKEKVMMKKK